MLCDFRSVGGAGVGPNGETGIKWGRMCRVSRVAQRMAESGPRCFSHDHSSQRNSSLMGPWKFYRSCQGSSGMRSWVSWVREAYCPRFICKEYGSDHLPGKTLFFSFRTLNMSSNCFLASVISDEDPLYVMNHFSFCFQDSLFVFVSLCRSV